MKKLNNPRGMNDKLTDAYQIAAQIEGSIINTLRLNGFQGIATPVIEYYEVFNTDKLRLEEGSVYKLLDREGNIMALRPDLTVPCARVAATKLKNAMLPLKLFYSGSIYRIDSSNENHMELHQIGAEIFGADDIWADEQAIMMACDCLKAAGLKDYSLFLGHAGIFESIKKRLSLSEENEKELEDIIRKKNLVGLQSFVFNIEMDEILAKLLLKLPQLFGQPEKVFSQCSELYEAAELSDTLDYIKALCINLKEHGIAKQIQLDLSIVGGLGYYTGTLFKVYSKGAPGALISGGRYDSLTEEFGYECPATGFALYLNQIVHIISQDALHDKDEKHLVIFQKHRSKEAYAYANQLRKAGTAASVVEAGALRDVDGYMAQYGYSKLKIFGREERVCLK
ncbi:MAG: ATP phosphoribosyltransferase regulatory subunit [Bacillota bacterium]